MAVSEVEFLKEKELKSSTKEDLESLLELAEKLKDRCDLIEREIERLKSLRFTLKIAGVILLIISITSIFYLLFGDLYQKITLVILSFIAWILFTVVTKKSSRELMHLQKVISPEKFALREVLQLLRETSNLIADKENWSVLARAEFRIRLSRFNLEDIRP